MPTDMPGSTSYAPDPNTHPPRLIEMACWAHARRKIYEVEFATGLAIAKEALQHIANLFAIEAGINGRRPQERLAARQQEAVGEPKVRIHLPPAPSLLRT
jgi:hypothetical protein